MKYLEIRSNIFLAIILSIFISNLSSLYVFANQETLKDNEISSENSWTSYENIKLKDYEKAQKYEMRGAWVPTVINLNMPPCPTKSDFDNWSDEVISNLLKNNLNVLIFQVRPNADALYKSKIVPWSTFITGIKQGTDPGYDPLQILIEKCHSNGIELHAWFNPYRIGNNKDLDKLDKKNIAVQHPEWTMIYGKQCYLNPGIPEVKEHLKEVIKEVVDNYDIDAVHFDDFFYPYPIKDTEIPDQYQFEQYGKEFDNINDWRRYNVTDLIVNVNETIKSSKSWVQFGISPFGIWKNKKEDDLEGSDTKGLESYHAIFADSIEWIKRNAIDYLAPQIYWSTENKIANFIILQEWWSDQVKKYGDLTFIPVNLYLGLANYKVETDSDIKFKDPYQIADQINLIRKNENIKGQLHYSYKQVMENKLNHNTIVSKNLYNYKALTPPINSNNKIMTNAPKDVKLINKNEEIELNIGKEDVSVVRKYSIYRFEDCEQITYENKNLLGVIYNKDNTNIFIDKTAEKNKNYIYAVKSISVTGIESDDSTIVVYKCR